ncbi:hypothetical protein [Bradyrhizobium japonicum]|uniref:hypothetical protein n=1 Tax=Bradyrhizobium japonicum TaxID=375 RepID=UPI00041024E6|nr:hypothetical protein [Bradyrhizobium japonicum]
MNGPVDLRKSQPASVLPPQFEALCFPPLLLPGENIDHYQALQALIFRDLDPHSAIEWLLAIDIAELSWEMQRYRVLRHRLLSTYRQKAVEMTLRRVDLAGIAPDFQDVAEIYIIGNALDWQLDASAALDIEARLRSYGFDQHAVSMEVYVQAREILSLFESLLNGAQVRRLLLIKEFNALRQSARRPSNRRAHRTALLRGGERQQSLTDDTNEVIEADQRERRPCFRRRCKHRPSIKSIEGSD